MSDHPFADHKDLALGVATDPDHRFDLALAMDKLDIALEIAEQTPAPESEVKWKAVGDRALKQWKFGLAKRCFEKGGDLGGMFLVATSMGDGEKDGLREVGRLAGAYIALVFTLTYLIDEHCFRRI